MHQILLYLNINQEIYFALKIIKSHEKSFYLKPEETIKIKKSRKENTGDIVLEFRFYPENIQLELLDDNSKIFLFYSEMLKFTRNNYYYCLPEDRVLYNCAYVYIYVNAQAYFVSFLSHKLNAKSIIKNEFDQLFPQSVIKEYKILPQEWIDIAENMIDLLSCFHPLVPRISFQWNEMQETSSIDLKMTITFKGDKNNVQKYQIINRKIVIDTRNDIKKHCTHMLDCQDDADKLKEFEVGFAKISELAKKNIMTVNEILDRMKERTASCIQLLKIEFKPWKSKKNNVLNSDPFITRHYQTKEVKLLGKKVNTFFYIKFNYMEENQKFFLQEIISNKESLFSIERLRYKKISSCFKQIKKLEKHNLELKL
ncbi:hypothetical protein HZS_1444, partial [Henneguya salminicola]